MGRSNLDFVLSRIAYAETTSEDWVSADYDKEWNEFIELRLEPNKDLPASVQAAILRGFEKGRHGIRIIRCRKALLYYINKKLFSAAQAAGVCREDFLLALSRFRVSPFQYSPQEILAEAGYDS
jgi:hypothetical protein